MQKALQQMNIKLEKVLSDITGVTGMSILSAILAGERNSVTLAKLRDDRCHQSEETIAKALQGNWREEHLFALSQAVTLYRTYYAQIAECDQRIEACLALFPDASEGKPLAKSRTHRTHRSTPRFDVRTAMYRVAGIDLTRIDGIQGHTALKILSEIGTDVSRWPTVKHFCSWMRLCPNTKITGGKRLSSRVLPTANRVAAALRLAAAGLHHSQTALGSYLRRMKAKLGGAAAVTATAHKLARMVYFVLRDRWEFNDPGPHHYEAQQREHVIKSLTRKAENLGFQLVPFDSPPACS